MAKTTLKEENIKLKVLLKKYVDLMEIFYEELAVDRNEDCAEILNKIVIELRKQSGELLNEKN